MSDAEEKAPDSTPTLPSPPAMPFKVKSTPVPKGVRKLSGSMIFRFEEAIKKLDEPARKLDEVRAAARDLVTTEEKESLFPRPITLMDPVEMEADFPLPKKD